MTSLGFVKRYRTAAAAVGVVSLVLAAGVAQAAAIALPVIVPVAPAPPPPPVDECDSGLFASAQYLYMTRRDPAPTPLVTDATPGDYLDASDFQFGWVDGFDARVGYIHCRIGFDIGGFMIRSWGDEIEVVDIGATLVLETDPTTNVDDPNTMYALNRTELDGADANIHFAVSPNLTLYAGAAYVRLADELLIEFGPFDGGNQDNGIGDYAWTVFNNMIGPQIGFRATLGPMTPGTFFLGTDVRAGLLFNRINNDLFVLRSDGIVTGTDTINALSPMVAGSIKAGFQATSNISITAGYRAIWLGNVALAPDQVAQSPNLNVAPGAVTIGTTAGGNFLAHGLEVGIQLNF